MAWHGVGWGVLVLAGMVVWSGWGHGVRAERGDVGRAEERMGAEWCAEVGREDMKGNET